MENPDQSDCWIRYHVLLGKKSSLIFLKTLQVPKLITKVRSNTLNPAPTLTITYKYMDTFKSALAF